MELQAGINKFYVRCSPAESSDSTPDVHPQLQQRSRVISKGWKTQRAGARHWCPARNHCQILSTCLQADVSLFCPAPLPGSKVSTISGTKHEEKALLRGKVHKCGLDARLIQLEAPVSSEHGRAHSHLIQKALKTYPRIPILYIFPWNCCILVTIYFPYKNILPSMFFFPNFCRKNNRSGYNYTLMLASLQALC